MGKQQTVYDAALLRIAEQEERIARQERLVARLRSTGRSAKQAEDLLDLMRTTLGTLHASLPHFPN